MKKMLYGFLFFLFISTILSCSELNTTTEEKVLSRLDTPTNIVLDGAMVSWDDVEGASNYDIYLNENIFNISSNYYLIEEEGDFNIKVIAKGKGYLDSLPTDILVTTITYQDNVIYNVNIIDDIIFWEDVTNASEYKIYINGDIYSTTNTDFNLVNINDGLLIINIQAIFEGGQANLSDSELIEHNTESVRDRNFQYSINSTQNIYIMDLNVEEDLLILNESGELLDENDVLVRNNYYEIKSDYIISLQDCEIIFYIYYGKNKSKVHITMSETNDPYIISSKTVFTSGEKDIKLQFELFGVDFKQIDSNQLDSKDYIIENNFLTIKASYINSRFQIANSFSVNYAIEKTEIITGSVVFYKET
ncbi:MAG: hypothetical protein K9L64_06745 [Candidatus Izimaplasma sp.]|nr:hypothetical protein [Candidatus Izimaplasma bacterium]